MNPQQRSIGIDLFRGLAILAVVILHVDEGIQATPTGWSQITSFALFAVPFFLALSFYLAIDKLYRSSQPYPLRSRLVRLLVPYGIWSSVYLFYKVIKYGASGEMSRLVDLVSDPLALFCFGTAAFHLYFLPLLAIGTVLIKFSEWAILKKISLRRLALLCLLSLLIYEVLLSSGNEYQLSTAQAFQPLLKNTFPTGNSNPLLRLILVLAAWMIRCAPYVLISMILARPSFTKFIQNITSKLLWLWLFIIIGLNLFITQFIPRSIAEIVCGYSALLAAISISSILKYNYWIENLGTCSFGIYFIHLLIIEIFQSIAKRIYPNYIYTNSSVGLLLMAVVVVILSWTITSLLMKNKKLSKIIF
jgi:fucose 4-O-acetylase-like acetyltransferase